MGEEFESLEEYEKEELLKKLKITWTYNSNAIEGNTLTEGDTTFIIENGLTVQGKSLAEHNQVVGHMKALDLVYRFLDKDTISFFVIAILTKYKKCMCSMRVLFYDTCYNAAKKR